MADELFSIVFTDDDVLGLAEDAGVPADVALGRARAWAKHIAETATQLCNEQLASVVEHDAP